jgi:PAS domain-containing protein
MGSIFDKLFDQSMMPHGHCYLWNEDLVHLHVISDLVIALSYYSIPIALITLIQKRQDLHFNYLFQLFALFIFACGTTHLISIYNVWNGAYWFAGTAKALTAVVSVLTAILVWPMIPKALAIPSTDQLKNLNGELQNEVATNRELRDSLERMVYSRTEELENARMEVEKQARRYRTLSRSLSDIFFVADRDGKFLEPQLGWERLTGQVWSAESGYDIPAAIAESDREIFRDAWKNNKSVRKTIKLELKLHSKQHEAYRQCVMTISPIMNDSDALVEWIAAIKDIQDESPQKS